MERVPANEVWAFIRRELDAGGIVVIGPDDMTPEQIKATTAVQLFVGSKDGDRPIWVIVREPEAAA